MKRALAVLALWPAVAGAVECQDLLFQGQSFTTCAVDPATEDLRLFHADADGQVLGTFSAVNAQIAPAQLGFAMNAGMYHDDRSPVGLYVEQGEQKMRVVPNAGPGNFGMLPNGVLCLTDNSAQVIETRDYIKTNPDCRDATQSGPMLVIDGTLHPRFIDGGTSVYIRNGVGVTNDGQAIFAISNEPVNFHTFGRLFRDVLETPNALFLDGKVSRLYAPSIGRSDFGFVQMGPIVGVVDAVDGKD